jgi:GWxTD domain-containing protein
MKESRVIRPRIRRLGIGLVFLALGVVLAPSLASASGFSLFVHSLLDTKRRPSISVNTSLPYSALVFLKKTEERYEADYRVYIRIMDPRGKETVDQTYKDTNTRKRSSSLSRKFAVPPGDYLVQCTVQVKNTHLAYRKEAVVSVPDFLKSGVGLSEPRLFAAAIDTVPPTILVRTSGDVPKPELNEKETPQFAHLDRQPAFTFEVYLDKAVRDSVPCELVYQVVDKNSTQLLYGRKRVKLFGSSDEFLVHCNVDDWDSGMYSFEVKAFLTSRPGATEANLRFSLVFSRAMLTKRFGETMDILSLIASKEEIDAFKNAAEAERAEVWNQFWAKRDPTPGTERNEALDEYLRRVRHASENFAQSGTGWRSDRGRVYIKYGEPDEIEVKADPYYEGDYLIWRYYKQNLTFVFYDRFGLGEYQLTNTNLF